MLIYVLVGTDLTLSFRPIAFKRGTSNELDVELTANPYPTWAKLEELVDKGKIRNIGISKYVDLLICSSVVADVIFPRSFNIAR